MASVNEENDSPDFFNFDGMSSPLKNEKEDIKEKKKFNLKIIIIISIVLLIIIAIILFVFIYKLLNPEIICGSGSFLPDDSKSECYPCSLKYCDKCSGTKGSNICTSCISNSFPFKENNVLKICNPCDIGEDDKCVSCDEGFNKCSKCNIGYKLENGKCIVNYSFKAIYFVDPSPNKRVSLISQNYPGKIKEIIIDGDKIDSTNYYYDDFSYGDHTVYILLDNNSISKNMFSFNSNLKEISFSTLFNNIEIESMESMFYGCNILTSIDFTNFKIKNVKSLDKMFFGCTTLININISNINISEVINMNLMFRGCKNLKNIEFPNITTNKLQKIEEMFSGCSSLKSLDLSNFDTKQVTSFSDLFNECRSLTSLNIDNFDAKKVENMNNMFKDCISLKY